VYKFFDAKMLQTVSELRSGNRWFFSGISSILDLSTGFASVLQENPGFARKSGSSAYESGRLPAS
jgi:hypothetical protein